MAWREIVHTQKGGTEMLVWIESLVEWCLGDPGHQDITRKLLTILKTLKVSPSSPCLALNPMLSP